MASWPVLVFDIESIPDVAGLRSLRQMDASVDDAAVYDAEIAERAARGKGDFMPHYLQRVLVISCVFRNADGLKVHSLVDRETGGTSQEGRVIQSFFNMIERHEPQLVSWNGSGFDLPVLHYRGLRHGVVASKYWDLGDDDREYRYNNYVNRYHLRHLDLMDLLALYQPRANAPLDAMARLCGLPGKLGMDGSQVFAAYKEGRLEEIRRYCETDVMNTYLLYCRFQQMRGGFSDVEYQREIAGVRELLAGLEEPHWREYLGAWPEEAAAPVAPPAAAPAPALVAATSPEHEAVSLAAVSVSVSVLEVASEVGSAAVPQAEPADSPSTREQG
jgi:predicted PolB exonuclease-like 3'-5' exonuclease